MEQPAPSKCMDVGSACHAAILEPHAELVVEIPDSVLASNGAKSGNKWKEFKEEHDGRILLKAHEAENVRRVRDAVYKHPIAGRLLRSNGPTEESVFWTCGVTGLKRKLRYDKFTDGFLIDLKTTEDCSPHWFAKTAANFDYEIQASFYVDGIQQTTGEEPTFVWIVASVNPPYPVRVYRLSPACLAQGWKAMRRSLNELALAHAIGDFSEPGENEVVEIDLPVWKQQLNEGE
jgi:hypothetical protein